MASIKSQFKQLLSKKQLTMTDLLTIMHHDFGSTMSRSYLYELLNHPGKIKLGHIQMFQSILGLDNRQAQLLFFKSRKVTTHEQYQ